MFSSFPQNQEIHFENGEVLHVDEVIDVRLGKFCHLLTKNNKEYITNPSKVNYIIVEQQPNEKINLDDKYKDYYK